MKTIVSLSLGSSKRDFATCQRFFNEEILIKRIGTDGNLKKLIEMIQQLDGYVDAFGMGGIDLYLYAGPKRYIMRQAQQIADAAKLTPIFDGSCLKLTLEKYVIDYLKRHHIVDFKDKKVFMVCAVDRFGMAEGLKNTNAYVTFGDLLMIGIPIPFHSLTTLKLTAWTLLPLITQLPVSWLYPIGKKQEENRPRFKKIFANADIIAGDFLFIKFYMPLNLKDKIILTNTVTQEDVEELRRRGAKLLVTTTPSMDGRSFGTNVIEALLYLLNGTILNPLPINTFEKLYQQLGLKPRIEWLNCHETHKQVG